MGGVRQGRPYSRVLCCNAQQLFPTSPLHKVQHLNFSLKHVIKKLVTSGWLVIFSRVFLFTPILSSK